MAQLPVDQGISRFKANEERVDQFVNGETNENWTTSNGSVVPTVKGVIERSLGAPLAAANRAEAAAAAAASARDAGFVNADVYADVATGRAAVANGVQFQVVSGSEIIRYRRDSGTTQTEMARYPRSAVLANEITARIAQGKGAGLPRLTITGGTPDAILAEPVAGVSDLDVNSTGSYVMLRPNVTNTAANPTLQIGTGFTRTIHQDDGSTIGVGRLVPGVWHIINIASNGSARIQGVFVKPTELPAIRDAANAASAAAAALTAEVADIKAQPSLQYAQQTGAALPARPNGSIVHWYCWGNPTALMQGYDLWFQLPEPTVPPMPSEASWRWTNARTGTSGALQILSLPGNSIPPITGIRYRIDGGAWVSIPAHLGDILITGLTNGQNVGLELQYVNFVGEGVPTDRRTITVNGTGFTDNFNRADQPLSNDPRWLDVAIGSNNRRARISSNAVRPEGANESYAVQVQEYFAPNQFVEATIVSAGTNTSSPRGVSLYARMPQGAHGGYRLRLAGASWTLSRMVNGSPTTLASGSRTATFPVQARLVAQGNVITALIGGAVVATFADTDPTAFADGTVGLLVNAASADGVGSVRIDNFEAGNV